MLEAGEDLDKTDARILDTAVTVMAEYGFRRASMDDVARKAGVSRVTVYRRFSDKDTLVQAVVLRECRRSLQAILRDIAELPAEEERFVQGFVSTVTLARSHPLFRRMLDDGEQEMVLPRYVAISASQAMDVARQYMGQLIGGLQPFGHFPNQKPEETAELLIRLWHSIVLTPSSALCAENEAQLTRFVRGFLYPLLSR